MLRALLASLLASLALAASGAPAAGWTEQAKPVFTQVDTRSLRNADVTALAQDKSGYIWVATLAGLARYDGYQFRSFLPDPLDARRLPDGFINTLLVDRADRLWLGLGSSGLAQLDRDSESFQTWRPVPGRPASGRNASVLAMADADGGRLWVGGDAGLDLFDPASGRFDAQQLAAPGEHQPKVLCLRGTRAGALWVGTEQGLYVRGAGQSGFVALALDADAAAPARPVWHIEEDSLGRLWVGSTGRVVVFDAARRPLLRFVSGADDAATLAPGIAYALIEARPGVFWVGSQTGMLSVIDAASGRVRRIAADFATPNGLRPGQLRQFLRDRSGLIWTADYFGGLYWHNPLPQGIYTLSAISGQEVQENAVSLAFDDLDRLWLGTSGGALSVQEATGPRVAQQLPAGKGAVSALQAGKAGEILVGSITGLCRIARRGAAAACEQAAAVLGNQRIWRIADGGDVWWVGTSTGLVRMDKASGATSRVESLPRADVSGLYVDRKGRLWAGMRSALYLIDGRQVRSLARVPSDAATVGPGMLGAFVEDLQGRYWIGSVGGPLNMIEEGADGSLRVRRLGPADGVLGDNFPSLAVLPDGSICATNSHGLVMIDPHTLKGRELGVADGVGIAAHWMGSVARARDGAVFFGGVGGVTVVAPGAASNWSYVPPLVVTELHVGQDSLVAEAYASGARTLELADGRRDLSLSFAALDYSNPAALRYAYRLDGYDERWTEADASRRVAAYAHLPPGDYTLQLRATNRQGRWSGQQLNLPVRVAYLWYERAWFKALVAALAALLIYAGMRGRTAVLRRRGALLAATVERRTRELTASAQTVAQLGRIGQELTASLKVQDVYATLYRHAVALLAARGLSVWRVDAADAGRLALAYAMRGEQPAEAAPALALADAASPIARAARERREFALEAPQRERLLVAPLLAGERLLGVLAVDCAAQTAYGERERTVLLSLCSHGAIALDNALAYRELDDTLSALKGAQTRIIQQEKLVALGSVVAGVAHEINTPVGVAIGAATQLADTTRALRLRFDTEALKRSEMLAYLSLAEDLSQLVAASTQRAGDLIRSFKQVSADQASESLREIDLPAYLGEVLRTLEPLIRRAGAALDIDSEPGLRLHSYPGAIAQILTNLIQNAIVHGLAETASPRIRIGLAARQQAIVLTVSDNGSGMAPEVLEKAFDPFFTTRRNQGGTGLGLHIIHNLVTGPLQGEVSLSSRPGEGTTVQIVLKQLAAL